MCVISYTEAYKYIFICGRKNWQAESQALPGDPARLAAKLQQWVKMHTGTGKSNFCPRANMIPLNKRRVRIRPLARRLATGVANRAVWGVPRAVG